MTLDCHGSVLRNKLLEWPTDCRAAHTTSFSARSEIIVCQKCAQRARTLPRARGGLQKSDQLKSNPADSVGPAFSNSAEVRSAVVDSYPSACPKRLPAPLKRLIRPTSSQRANPLGIGSPWDTPEPSICRGICSDFHGNQY